MGILHQILQWIGDETYLYHLLQGFPTIALLGVVAICILSLAKGADWMIDGVVDLTARGIVLEDSADGTRWKVVK